MATRRDITFEVEQAALYTNVEGDGFPKQSIYKTKYLYSIMVPDNLSVEEKGQFTESFISEKQKLIKEALDTKSKNPWSVYHPSKNGWKIVNGKEVYVNDSPEGWSHGPRNID